ncbi:MAG: serine/threonine kinase PknH [Solirubrobacteraceae bacterium]|nr:serine/threonine kinase PknH [Solirubrobacteraceae bacterium]
MLQAGETLAGYRIEAIAGVGGMGVVYRATQLSLERRVALKVLSTTLVGNQRFRERFRLEGRHAAALDHPNIIPVYEAGESNGLMFIAMRFVDGPTLADMIMQQALSGRETLRILAAIASALDAAHDSGLVHRDVKPHNILLTSGGHPYLADFGITKGAQASGLTNSGDFVGSVSYVSPEQIDGRDVTRVSDNYSLTAVLFHCLTGTLPYEHDTEAALMHAHLFAAPPTISGLGITDAPPALDSVFARGMAKEPSFRYERASELVEACREAMEGAQLDRCPALVANMAFGSGDPPAPDAWAVAPGAAAPAVPPQAPAAAAAYASAAGVLDPALAPAGSSTAADRRREPPAPASAPEEPLWRSALSLDLDWDGLRTPALLVAGMLALVAAPLLGYALGHRDEPAGLATARSQSLQVGYTAPWRPSGATIAGLGVDGAVGLGRPDGTVLVAGRLRDPSPGFDPAPAELRSRAARRPQPVRVRVGDRDGVRYAVPLRAGGSLWMIAFPDTKGWTTVACRSTGGPPAAACASVAATLRSRSGSPVALGPDKGTAAQLNSAIRKLSSARLAAKPGLGSRSYATRARALERLASADTVAARALAALKLRPQEAATFAGMVKALRAEASILRRLSRAAAGRRRATYNQARGALRRAERGVRTAERDLRAAGYTGGT